MSTFRQKLVASKLAENGGNMGKAMVAAGYSPNTAKTPGKLTRSKGWQELMNSLFPDKLLLKKHKELLEAKKIIVDRSNGHAEVIAEEIDSNTVVKALDMAYKLKGYYSPKRHEIDQRVTTVEIVSYADTAKKEGLVTK